MNRNGCPNPRVFSLFLALLSALGPISAESGDWPQYRGPHLNGTTEEEINLSAWPKEGPKVRWRVPAPLGFSSFSVVGGKAFTLVGREDSDGLMREVCVALDADTGKELWAFPMCISNYDGGGDSGTSDNDGGDGPRSTPTVDGNRVYVYDSQLGLYCLDADSGKVVWQKNIVEDFNGRNIRWQSAASPLLEGNLICVPGGGPGESFIAFDKVTGEPVWKSGDEKMTHAMPVPATILGVRQIVFFAQSGLVSVDAKTGKELWKRPFPYKTSTAASPILTGDLAYCSAGYGIGGGLARIKKTATGFEAEEVWRKENDVINHWSTPVHKDGFLYGMFSFKKHGEGPMQCVELLTGEVKWSKDKYGPGNCILTGSKGDKLLALADNGELVVVEATPDDYKELARNDVIDGKCWSTPTLANGRIYVRSTKEAICLDLSGALETK